MLTAQQIQEILHQVHKIVLLKEQLTRKVAHHELDPRTARRRYQDKVMALANYLKEAK